MKPQGWAAFAHPLALSNALDVLEMSGQIMHRQLHQILVQFRRDMGLQGRRQRLAQRAQQFWPRRDHDPVIDAPAPLGRQSLGGMTGQTRAFDIGLGLPAGHAKTDASTAVLTLGAAKLIIPVGKAVGLAMRHVFQEGPLPLPLPLLLLLLLSRRNSTFEAKR